MDGRKLRGRKQAMKEAREEAREGGSKRGGEGGGWPPLLFPLLRVISITITKKMMYHDRKEELMRRRRCRKEVK